MSRTKPEEHASNPVEYKLEWVGHEEGGHFSVWDRENKCAIELKLPLRFAYLNTRKAVGGYYEAVKRSFFSNEIAPFSKEEFDVRYYKDGNAHPVAKGTWADIKGEVGQKGAKYCNVVYATLLNSTSDDIPGGSLVKLPFMGAAGSEWINLEIKDGQSFEITGFEDCKKGRTKYRAPVFKLIEITEDEGAIADEQDKALLEYFSNARKGARAESAPSDEQNPAGDPPVLDEVDEDEIPF